MLIYFNFTKVKNKLLRKKQTIKNINRDKKKGHLQVTKMLNIVFAKFTRAIFWGPAFYLTFKNLK